MTDKAKSNPNPPLVGSTGVDVLAGVQSLTDGLVYDADGNVIERKPDDKPVLVDQRIGVYRRVVHEDGSVSTFQVDPIKSDGDISKDVPLPGERQDQTDSGLSDANADVKTTSGSKK